jgi:hypothetical protein
VLKRKYLRNLTNVPTSDLQETIAELREKVSSGPAIADISNWLDGDEEESLQIVRDEEIINNALEDNSENERELSTPPTIRTIRHDDVMSVLNTCYKMGRRKESASGRHPHIKEIAKKKTF